MGHYLLKTTKATEEMRHIHGYKSRLSDVLMSIHYFKFFNAHAQIYLINFCGTS